MYKLRWFSKGPRRSYLLEPHKYTMLSELVNRNCQIPHNGFYQMDQMEAKTLLDQALAAPPRDPRAAGATSPLCFEAWQTSWRSAAIPWLLCESVSSWPPGEVCSKSVWKDDHLIRSKEQAAARHRPGRKRGPSSLHLFLAAQVPGWCFKW